MPVHAIDSVPEVEYQANRDCAGEVSTPQASPPPLPLHGTIACVASGDIHGSTDEGNTPATRCGNKNEAKIASLSPKFTGIPLVPERI